MSFWTAAVVIVAIWAIVQVYTYRRDRIANVTYDEDGYPLPSAATDEQTKRELEELRERVKVLEQITVDGREAKQIADEIEKLRDN